MSKYSTKSRANKVHKNKINIRKSNNKKYEPKKYLFILLLIPFVLAIAIIGGVK